MLRSRNRFAMREGGVVERLIAPVLKTGEVLKPSWVRIPPPPFAYTLDKTSLKIR